MVLLRFIEAIYKDSQNLLSQRIANTFLQLYALEKQHHIGFFIIQNVNKSKTLMPNCRLLLELTIW